MEISEANEELKVALPVQAEILLNMKDSLVKSTRCLLSNLTAKKKKNILISSEIYERYLLEVAKQWQKSVACTVTAEEKRGTEMLSQAGGKAFKSGS